MARIQRIRQKIIDRTYYLSSHAEEEMLDDELTRDPIENVILRGRIDKKLSQDIRGTVLKAAARSLEHLIKSRREG